MMTAKARSPTRIDMAIFMCSFLTRNGAASQVEKEAA